MKVAIAAVLAVNILGVGPAGAQLRLTPSESAATGQIGDAFRRCASDAALWALRREEGQADQKHIIDQVLSMCGGHMEPPNDILLGPQNELHAWIHAQMSQARREVAELVRKLAPRAKAEKADMDQVGASYYSCLERHAKVLALATDEAADLVAQASLSACPAERKAIFDVHRRYNEDWNEGTMKAMEGELAQRLLLAIVEMRAQRNVAPGPASEPKPKKTPI